MSASLENTIERAVALESGTRISVDSLPDRIRNHYHETIPSPSDNGNAATLPEGGLDLGAFIEKVERSYLLAALERSDGVRTHAAELLKMSYRSFRHFAKKYDI